MPRKRKPNRQYHRRMLLGHANGGYIAAIGIVGMLVVLSASLTGRNLPTNTVFKPDEEKIDRYACCDSGSGAACQPNRSKQLSYNGEDYALLKSGIFNYSVEHMEPTDQYTSEGYRIFINTSDKTSRHYTDQCPRGMDLIAKHDPKLGDIFEAPYYGGCIAIPDEQLVYACKATPEECTKTFKVNATPFDAYYRLSDGPVPMDLATKCPKPAVAAGKSPQRIVGLPTPKGENNLQLETFQVVQDEPTTPWLSAWCKPAIYLYPEQTSRILVKVAPKGKFTLTIPQYPKGGWDVIAHPNGTIEYGNATFPYLYWEAAIPDTYINQPKDGYVVTHDELEPLFARILPALGLNTKERNEFSQYWTEALPESPYYFVGVMPQNELDILAPLSITPDPDSVLRVTLYFKALDKPMSVQEPHLEHFTRTGFTVTEWGGFFKADKNHKNFTCLM